MENWFPEICPTKLALVCLNIVTEMDIGKHAVLKNKILRNIFRYIRRIKTFTRFTKYDIFMKLSIIY